MATPRHLGRQAVARDQDQGDDEDDEASATSYETVPPAFATGPVSAQEPPTLGDAFRVLCEAMIPHLEDNVPAQLKCEEIQIWHANGNHAVAWTHAILLLEGILGVSIRA